MLGLLPSSYDCHYINRILICNQNQHLLNGKPVHCSIQSPIPSFIRRIIMLSVFDSTSCYRKLILTLQTEGVKVLLLLLWLLLLLVLLGVRLERVPWYCLLHQPRTITEWIWGIVGIITDMGMLKYSVQSSPSSTLSTKNPTQRVFHNDVEISLGD
jgi:hypothetical protein